MKEEEERVWKDCLKLWKRLREMPNQPIISITDFKSGVLKELDILECLNGCPFCQYYEGCEKCPLILKRSSLDEFCSCYDTPYSKWEDYYGVKKMHSQKLAKKFYKYLLNLYNEIRNEEED